MFKGLGGLGDMAGLMGKAKEMQAKMTETQENLANIMVEGQSGAGMVTATCSAKGLVHGLNVDASLINAEDKEVLEDLIVAAINEAQSKAAERSKEEMAKVTEGLGLPEGMNLPF